MLSYDNFSDIEEDHISLFSSNVLEPTENSVFEEEYILDGENQNFSFEMDNIYKELFENNNINHKKNDRTNEQTNKIFFTVTKDISLLNKKRYRNDDSENSTGENSNSENILENSENNDEEGININSENKDISNNKNKKHNRYCTDNVINKLKGYLFNHFLIDIVKKNSIKKDIILKKLPNKTFIADLNKKKNEQLFKMKMVDILRQEKISSKYSKYDQYYNRKIIDEIYEENKEKNVIKILELTFEELFIIFRRKLNNSKDRKKLEEIKNKIKGLDLLENDDYQDIQYFIEEDFIKRYPEPDKYIDKVKSLCLDYQKWFNDKKGRTTRKKMGNYL